MQLSYEVPAQIPTPTPAPTAAAQSQPFSDVPSGAPFASDVDWLHSQGITTGYADGTFRPTEYTTRGAMAAFLYRLLNPGVVNAPAPTAAPFADVPVSNPFAGDIAWLKEHHVTGGYADGTFRPNGETTRMAAAVFLYRAEHPGQGDAAKPARPPFLDIRTQWWFSGDVAWLKQEHITNGYFGGKLYLAPSPLTREAAAAFLHRFARLG